MATKTSGGMSNALRRAAAKHNTPEVGTADSLESRIARANALLGETAIAAPEPISHDRPQLTVPLTHCKPHPLNARRFYPPASELEFARKIANEGQMDAAKAIADPANPGNWLIIDGVRRLRVLTRNNAETINISVLDSGLSQLQIYLLSKSLNEARAEQTDLDNAFSWQQLIETGVVKGQRELGEELGISQATVSRVISLVDLQEPLLDIMRTDPSRFPYRIANELRLMARDRSVDLAVEQASLLLTDDTGNVTVRSLEALRLRPSASSTERRTRENPQSTTKLVIGGKPAGSLKVFPSGRLQLDLSGISTDLQQKIQDAITKVVNDTQSQE